MADLGTSLNRLTEPEALSVVADAIQRLVLRFARSMDVDTDTAEDVIQDVLLRLVQQPELAQKVTNPEGFLATVVRNQLLVAVRKRHYSLSLEDVLDLQLVDEAPPVREEQLEEYLSRALQNLSTREREFVNLHLVQKLSPEEVAARMNLPTGRPFKRLLRESMRELYRALRLELELGPKPAAKGGQRG